MINLRTRKERQEERDRQLKLTDAAAGRIRVSLRKEFIRVGVEAARIAESNLSNAALALREHPTHITVALTRGVVPLMTRIGADVNKAVESKSFAVETKRLSPEDLERIARLYMELRGGQVATSAAGVSGKVLARVINEGLNAGLSNAEIAKNINSTFTQVSRFRSETIARTESHTAAQFSSNQSVAIAAPEATKIWTTAGDERVRSFSEGDKYSHRAIDGQEKLMNQPFEVPGRNGTELLDFPGDPKGSAANIINCRCVQVYDA